MSFAFHPDNQTGGVKIRLSNVIQMLSDVKTISMKSQTTEEKLIRLLLARLERISVDSYWAHRPSGVRGALIRSLEAQEKPGSQTLESLSELGFQILERAAREKR